MYCIHFFPKCPLCDTEKRVRFFPSKLFRSLTGVRIRTAESDPSKERGGVTGDERGVHKGELSKREEIVPLCPGTGTIQERRRKAKAL
jgi:hypothetical protein